MLRKLTTIMVADIVGSTAFMAKNEEEAVVQIARCLDGIRAAISTQDGRVFSTAGDALLAEFVSPVNALRAALAARGSLAAVGSSPKKIRIGLHLADVVDIDGDLRGDGVNLAARIQSTAEPGEIDVSEALYLHVQRQSPCRFVDLGSRPMKGIDQPPRIYRASGQMDRHVFQGAHTNPAPAPAQDVHPKSIAVVPFVTAGAGGDDHDFLVQGFSEDLTLELGRIGDIFVSSRTAAEMISSKDPVEIGTALGVRYVLAGSLRRAGDRVRINVSLSETEKGALVWSERIDGTFDDILDILDDITSRVAATVSGRMEHEQLKAARLKRPENMSAYEFYLRGLERHRLGGVTDLNAREAMEWFNRAIEADPSFSRPYAMYVCSGTHFPEFDIHEGARMVSRSLELDSTDPEALRIMGVIQIKAFRDYEASREYHERAIQASPNDAYLVGRCAAYYSFVRRPERALELLDRAERLDPFLPVWVTEERVCAHYVQGHYHEVEANARRLPFQTRRSRLYTAAARAKQGNEAGAKELVAAARAEDPALSADYVRIQELYKDTGFLNDLIAVLRANGLPNHQRIAAAAE